MSLLNRILNFFGWKDKESDDINLCTQNIHYAQDIDFIIINDTTLQTSQITSQIKEYQRAYQREESEDSVQDEKLLNKKRYNQLQKNKKKKKH